MKGKNYKNLKYIIFLILIIGVGFIVGSIIVNGNKTKTSIDFYEKNLPVIFSGIKSDELGYFIDIPTLEKNGDYYQVRSSRFFTKMPAKQYQDPLVFEKNGKKIEFIPQQSVIQKTIAPIVYAKSNINYLIYRDAYELTDVVKIVQPDGIKEYLVLKSEQAPKKFEWILNIGDEIIIQKESDGAIRFYQDDIFLYRIPAPFMVDVNKQKSTDCEWQLDKIPASPDASQSGNDNQYKLTLDYNSDNLSYPIALDPSVTDSYDDETKVAAKSNTQITGGQAKLTSNAWYNASWLYRKQITINSTVVSESDSGELNFPLMINLASDSDLAADALSTGNDILFTSSNGETKLNHEIEKYDADGDLVAWINVSALSSTSDTTLYMYYGNSGATNQENVSASWDSNYIIVQHMNDDATASIQDSTSYSSDGTKKGANEPVEITDGKIGEAQDFDNTDDYVDLGESQWDGSWMNHTVSAWVKNDGTEVDTTDTILAKGGGSSIIFSIVRGGAGNYRTSAIMGTERFSTKLNVVNDGNWHFVVAAMNATNVIFYTDGAYDGTGTLTYGGDNNFKLVIGKRLSDSSSNYFNGAIDELRASKITRSAYWISNEYNNIASSSAFYSVGAEQGAYSSSGTLTSTNLLTGLDSQSIDSFYYNASSIPAGTELEIQFSPDGTTWYSTSGSLNQWDTISATGGETLNLSSLGWSGSSFYYRVQFASNAAQSQTPVMDNILLDYTEASTGTVRLKGGTRLKGGVRLK